MKVAVLPWVVDASSADAGVYSRALGQWLAKAAQEAGERVVAPLVMTDAQPAAALSLKTHPSLDEARTWCGASVPELWLGGLEETPGSIRLRVDRALPEDHAWCIWVEGEGSTMSEAWDALLSSMASARSWQRVPDVHAGDRAWVHRARHLDVSLLGEHVGVTHPSDTWRHLLEVVCRESDEEAVRELVFRLSRALDDPALAPHAADAVEVWCARQPEDVRAWQLALQVAEARGDDKALARAQDALMRAERSSRGDA